MHSLYNLHYEQFHDGTVKCIEDEIPFELPVGWAWCRLGTIYDHNTGKALNSSNINGVKLTYITTSNLYWDRFELDNLKEMPFVDSEIEKCTVRKGDLLVCEGGDIGRTAIWSYDENIRIQNHIHRLRAFITLSNRFYYYVFYLWKQLELIGGHGIGLQSLSSKALHYIILPLPPVNEQQRIAENINRFFKFVDELDNKKGDLRSLIEDTKSKILDLAIRGKLVPQDPNDEPASVLLERIRAEKEELIKQGKIKRNKKESVIFKGDDNSYYEKIGEKVSYIDDELQFSIPNSWAWCYITNISEILMGSSPDGLSINSMRNGIEFHQGKIHFTEKYIGLSDKSTNEPSKIAPANSVLLCVRAPVGEINLTKREICIGRGLSAIYPYGSISSEFLFYWLQTYKKYLNQQATGSTFVAITAGTVKSIKIPLPPICEQERIIKTIDSLYTQLDSIEKSLS